MPNVAQLSVVVDADTSAAERGMDSLGTKVGGIGSSIATAFGGAAIAGIAGLAVGIGTSVAAAADFEKTMSAVKAVSGATGEEMQSLSDLALQLGKDTSFSASEAGKGIEELVKGGLSIPDIMNGAAKATLDLAAAGGVSLPEAATIAANALAQFNLKGEDMGHVADLIAGAANASALDVSDFSSSLKQAGAVASTVGFSFDDLAQAIAVMGKAGITGSDAGTSLKTMMLNLQPSTKAQIAEFQRLGLETNNLQAGLDGMRKLGIEPQEESWKGLYEAMYQQLGIGSDASKWTKSQTDDFEKLLRQTGAVGSAFFDANGKVKSMADVAEVLKGAMAGMTEAQRLASLEILFGSDAIRAGAVLAKEGAAGFNEMAASMGKVTAEAVGAERLNNLSGAFEQLKGSLETAAITLGMSLLPVLTDLTKWATAGINAIIPGLDELGKMFAATVTALTADGEKAQEAFGALKASAERAFGPELAGRIADTLHDIRGTVETVVDAIKTLTSQSGSDMSADWAGAWGRMLRDTTFQTQQILAAIRVVALAIKGDWQSVWEELVLMDERAAEQRLAVAERQSAMLLGVIDRLTGGAATRFEESWSQLTEIVGKGWDAIVTATQTATEQVLKPIVETWNEARSVTETVFAAIKNVLIAVWDAIYQSAIKPKLDAISAIVTTVWGAIKAKTQEVFDAMLGYLRETIFEPMRAAIETKVNAARDVVAAAWQAISDKAHAILDPVLSFVRDTIFGPMQSSVETTSTGMSSAFSSAVSSIRGVVDGALQSVRSAWEGTWAAIQRAAESPHQAMEELIRLVNRLKDVIPSWLIPHSPTPFQLGLEGIMKAARKLDRTFGDMSGVDDWLRAALSYTRMPENWLEPLRWIVAHESSGDPRAKNPDSTASGLFQMIDTTWAASRDRDLPNDIWDPVINAIAGIRYIARRYGDPWEAVEFWKRHNHYAEGGWAGLHGPELAWLGERGPEYVVPNHALRSGAGPVQTHRVALEINGQAAAELYVTGREVAIRYGRATS